MKFFEVMDIYGDFLPNTEPSLSEPDYSTGLTGALPDPEYLKHNKSQTQTVTDKYNFYRN